MTTEEKLDKAWDFFNEGNYDESLKIAGVIKTTQDYSHLANYLLGHVAFAKKEFDDSIVYFLDALNSPSGEKIGGFINYWVGKVYEYTEVWLGDDNPLYDEQKAFEAYKQALKYARYPEDTVVRITHLTKSDEQKMIYYEAGIEKYPHYLEYYISLSKLFQKLEYPSKQIETLLSALPNVEKSSALYFSIALFYYENEELSLSEKYYLECIELLKNSMNPNIYYGLACCYQKAKKYDLAIEYFRKHNENNFKNDTSWYSTLSLIFCFDQKKRGGKHNNDSFKSSF